MGRNESIDIWQKESVDRLYDAPSCDNSVYIIIRKGIRLTTLVSVISVSSAFSAEWPSLDRIDERDYSSQTHIQKEYSMRHQTLHSFSPSGHHTSIHQLPAHLFLYPSHRAEGNTFLQCLQTDRTKMYSRMVQYMY